MIIAIDTGGTKTLIAGMEDGQIVTKPIRFETPKDPFEYISRLKTTLAQEFQNTSYEAVTIALPGIVKDGIAIWCQNLGWSRFDVRSELAEVLGSTPIYVENDANLAGLGEVANMHKPPHAALYVTISTGIGTGIITDGVINTALSQSEAGHAMVEYDGIVRAWEDFASGRAIYDTYQKYAREIHDKKTWNAIADRISRGFLAVIPTLQPDIIIVGGSIGTYFDQYGDMLVGILKDRLPVHIPCPKFVKAKHPEEAVLYGCYYYGVDQLNR